MPIVSRKAPPVAAPKPAKPLAKPAAPPPVSQAQVRAMLDEQAAEFAKQIESVTRAFTGALKAAMSQSKDKPNAGWDFKVEYLNNGDIDTICATPRMPKKPDGQ